MANNINESVDFATGYASYMVQDFDLVFDEEWAVNFVRRAYTNQVPLVDREKLAKYRALDRGEIDVPALKNVFDKKGKDNPEGGKAEYVNADFKGCPLYQSLNQITKGYILSEIGGIVVNGIDKISVDKKLIKRQKDAIKRYTIDYFNFIGSLTNQHPLPYTTNIDKLVSDKKESATAGEGLSMLDQIKSELNDDWSFAMLSDVGALKDGVESTHENMIKYFFEDGNFAQLIADEIVSDIMKSNTLSFRCYTSAKDGTLQYAYVDPLTLNVSPFLKKDCSDLDYVFQEFTVTWSEYMQMVGGKLTLEQNKKVYQANRMGYSQYNSYPEWTDNTQFYNVLNTTFIKLGYMELKKQVHDKNNGKYYDVIKKFYYLPIFNAGYVLQSKDFILDLGNLQDMHRFGGMLEMSKFSYVIFRDDSFQSWYEIQETNLFQLHVLWNKYQNTVAALIPQGVIFAEETLREIVEDMLNAQEEELKENGQEMSNRSGAYQRLLNDVIKRYTQSGRGIFKRRTGDANEGHLDPPTTTLVHNLFTDCEMLIKQMMSIYNMMIISLGTNAQMLGQAPKPRQAVRGIEVANRSGLTMLQNMIYMYNFGLTEFGTRVIYYDQVVIKEFDKKKLEPKTQRAEQMLGIVGNLGVNWMEIFDDMPIQKCGVIVEIKPTDEEKVLLFDYAMRLEQTGQLPIGSALTVKYIDNPKLAYLWLTASVKRQERIRTENQSILMQQQQQMAQQQQIAMQKAKALEENQKAQLQAQITQLEQKLKADGMSQNIAERGQNKMQENQQKAELDMQLSANERAHQGLFN